MALFLFWSSHSWAKVQVAFIQMPGVDHRHVQLENQGQFAHVAISYKGQWLHTHPYWGVQLMTPEELSALGLIRIIQLNNGLEPTDAEVKSLLGKAYDQSFKWEGEKYYCSKLVGKLLKMQPTVMKFDAAIWNDKKNLPKDELGLSPDDIFFELIKKGAREVSMCTKSFL